ncbi:hypothetical protein [Actinoplanes sp. HUAS TT8]|uniref:hypothetical protein n=1 Tax=Actinoplanes sp. HUAS TT8 TaxID=3447453 RepID=UPI003F5201FE
MLDPWPGFTILAVTTAALLVAAFAAFQRRDLYFAADGEIWWDLAGRTEVNGEPLRPAHR